MREHLAASSQQCRNVNSPISGSLLFLYTRHFLTISYHMTIQWIQKCDAKCKDPLSHHQIELKCKQAKIFFCNLSLFSALESTSPLLHRSAYPCVVPNIRITIQWATQRIFIRYNALSDDVICESMVWRSSSLLDEITGKFVCRICWIKYLLIDFTFFVRMKFHISCITNEMRCIDFFNDNWECVTQSNRPFFLVDQNRRTRSVVI